jgi:hypothetical protein
MTPGENQTIAKVMNSGDVTPFQESGINVEGENYNFVSQDGTWFKQNQ